MFSQIVVISALSAKILHDLFPLNYEALKRIQFFYIVLIRFMLLTKNKYKTVLYILLGLLFISSTALKAEQSEQEQIDSLKIVVQSEINKEKLVHHFNYIAYLFAGTNTDSTLFYVDKALETAQEANYKKGMAECYLYYARSFMQKGKLDKAIENYNQSLQINTELQDSANILLDYRGLSYVYSYSTSQSVSLDYSIKALAYAEALKDSASLSIIYNNIATIYKKLDNYESAIFYFEKSLVLDNKHGTPEDLAITHSNIGTTKVENGKLIEAATNYRVLGELLPQIRSDYLEAYFYLSFAKYYTEIEKLDSSQFYISKANTICKQSDYPQVLIHLYLRKSELLLKQQEYKACISTIEDCIALSNSMGTAKDFPALFKMQADAYSNLGKFQEAYQSSRQAHAYTDSLQNKKVAGSLGEFEKDQKVKLEMARQSLEKELLAQQTANSTIRLQFKYRLALIISLLLLIAGVIAVYSFFKLRRSTLILKQQHTVINEQKDLIEESFKKLQLSEKSLSRINAAKDKLFSIIAHDLRSPFNAILGFSNELRESYENYDNEQRKNMIALISSSSESTLFLLENLLNWARSQSESIQLNRNTHLLKALINESIAPYLGSAEIKALSTQNLIPEGIKVLCDKDTIKVVISNLYNNAIKFSSPNGRITINAEIIENKVQVCISDSGIGMSQNLIHALFDIDNKVQRPGTSNEKGTGLGLILCKEFIDNNDGRIWVESEENKGSKFYFTLPLSKA